MGRRPRIGIPAKQALLTGLWDAIVIGSGMGGLAAAAILAKQAQQRVLVLERHYAPGGFTHVFRRGPYEWDVGLHYIGQVHEARFEARRLFDILTDGKLAWAPLPVVYDRIRLGDRTYDLVAGADGGPDERFVTDCPGKLWGKPDRRRQEGRYLFLGPGEVLRVWPERGRDRGEYRRPADASIRTSGGSARIR